MEKNQVRIFDDNLFFSSVISGQLEKAGVSFRILSSMSQGALTQEDGSEILATVNLNALGFNPIDLIGQLKRDGNTKILGFCGHGQTELIQRGKEVGCDWVVPNSVAAKGLLNFLKRQKVFFPTPAQLEQKT